MYMYSFVDGVFPLLSESTLLRAAYKAIMKEMFSALFAQKTVDLKVRMPYGNIVVQRESPARKQLENMVAQSTRHAVDPGVDTCDQWLLGEAARLGDMQTLFPYIRKYGYRSLQLSRSSLQPLESPEFHLLSAVQHPNTGSFLFLLSSISEPLIV